MEKPNALELAQTDLFTADAKLVEMKIPQNVIERLHRLRDMYNWCISNPDEPDRIFVQTEVARYPDLSKVTIYDDLKIVKTILPHLSKASRDYHRWRFNEMILETYAMAKKRKDTKTMEKAAASYAKYNRVDLEDELQIPYHLILVQPFTATDDPTVLGINPIPNVDDHIARMLEFYRKETLDIDDVEYEEADLEEDELFNTLEDENGQENLLQ